MRRSAGQARPSCGNVARQLAGQAGRGCRLHFVLGVEVDGLRQQGSGPMSKGGHGCPSCSCQRICQRGRRMPLAHQGNILRPPGAPGSRPGGAPWPHPLEGFRGPAQNQLGAKAPCVRPEDCASGTGMRRGGRVVSAYCTSRFGRVSSSHGSLRTLTLAHKGAGLAGWSDADAATAYAPVGKSSAVTGNETLGSSMPGAGGSRLSPVP